MANQTNGKGGKGKAGNVGSVIQVIGPTVDVRFDPEHLPPILNALRIEYPERKPGWPAGSSSAPPASVTRSGRCSAASSPMP